MIKSMTGFGRAIKSDGKRNVTVELRAVNHRYCDINVRMAHRYSFAQEKIKAEIKKIAARGKIDVSVQIENLTESDINIKLNAPLAKQYYDNLLLLQREFSVGGDVSLEYLASLPDVLKPVSGVEDEQELMATIVEATRLATESLDDMRVEEGKKLAEDLLSRSDAIKNLVKQIAERAPIVPKVYKEKLYARISELLADSVQIPEERIMLETAIFADKCSIDEELTRLSSHMDQLEKIIDEDGEPDGKRLDFLVQEMNREANTIASKANDITITELILKVKAEVEKIREQVQNIE